MKLLLVSDVNPWTRSVASICHYVAACRRLGHEVAVFGEAKSELPELPFTTAIGEFDLALFIVQVVSDFPDMPLLARLLDGVPRERRAVADLWARSDETIRVDHDFNHLEKLDGHLGWEWQEALAAIAGRIWQPTLTPRRPEVKSFLFHGFDPASVTRPYESVKEAVEGWRDKAVGVSYIGSNWHRWEQVRRFLEAHAPLRDEVGRACLIGWDWDARPDWAVRQGIQGVETNPTLLTELGVEVWQGVRFDQVIGLLSQARFVPVIHRPLFRHLGFVTNRTFETFCADTVPVLMLPPDFVESVYGPAALALVPGDDVTGHLRRALADPEAQWEAVLRTRAHLARHHSFARRFAELQALTAR